MQDLAAHLHLDGRLGQQLLAVPLLHQDGVVDDPEGRHVVGGMTPDE